MALPIFGRQTRGLPRLRPPHGACTDLPIASAVLSIQAIVARTLAAMAWFHGRQNLSPRARSDHRLARGAFVAK
jgi:hypothetical protein